MSNHEEAERYMMKAKLIGNNTLKLKIKSDDEVELVQVLDTESTGRIVVPRFITKIASGAFIDCLFEDVYINNRQNKRLVGIFEGIKSERLRVEVSNPEVVIDTSMMFRKCRNLKSIELINFKTTNLGDAGFMFSECDKLEKIDFGGLDTSNVCDMCGMFYRCKSLKDIDIDRLSFENVSTIEEMFSNTNIEEMDLSNKKCYRLERMNALFKQCKNLRKVNLNGIDTSRVELLSSLFENCESLENVEIEELDISSVVSMSRMFKMCHKIEKIQMPRTETMQLTSLNDMFKGCFKLKSIDI